MKSSQVKLLHGFLFFGLTVVTTSVESFRVWPWLWIVSYGSYAAVIATVPVLRSSFRGWPLGRGSGWIFFLTALIALGACGVLLMFDHFVNPDVRAYATFLPVNKLGGLAIAALLFSISNAVFEEVAFRGILFEAIDSQSSQTSAVIGTAVLFGYAHMQGYPPGPMGAVLAGVFGLCLGWLRVLSGGIGLPMLAHIAADATIFTLVARTGVFNLS